MANESPFRIVYQFIDMTQATDRQLERFLAPAGLSFEREHEGGWLRSPNNAVRLTGSEHLVRHYTKPNKATVAIFSDFKDVYDTLCAPDETVGLFDVLGWSSPH